MDVFLICMLWLLSLIVFLILTQNDKKAAEALKKSRQAELPYFKQIKRQSKNRTDSCHRSQEAWRHDPRHQKPDERC